ncbi:MAG: phosphoribosylanthranilate isomerase [Planctomycetes bacterium]|nr:phosphoribosylanthranilate isomerase [Planctomycetota bacterium]
MFRTKICGITRIEDAQHLADAGADAIGLNFYTASPRYVDRNAARQIVDCLPPHIAKVGVFVNASPEEIAETVQQVGLSAVQIHGDETPDQLADVIRTAGVPVIRAFRLDQRGLAPVVDYLRDCERNSARPRMVLVDAYRRDAYGGTGETVHWQQLRGWRSLLGKIPLILAGGLSADNVEQAIKIVRPDAVDTASGVETEPGFKDVDAMRRFVSRAVATFESKR